MDSKMIDNEDRREDRKLLPDEKTIKSMSDLNIPAHNLPNRKQRRAMAKERGLFKTKVRGAWAYVNNRGDKNEPFKK